MAFIQWGKLSDEELISYAKENFPNYTRTQLKDASKGLTNALYERNLMDKLAPTKGNRWRKMNDDEIVDFLRKNYPDVKTRQELRKVNKKLLLKLHERGLVNLIFERQEEKIKPDFKGMTNEEITIYSKNEHGELSRSILRYRDPFLYSILIERNIVDKVTKKKNHKDYGDWRSMSDDELISYVKERFPELKNKQQVRKINLGLTNTLEKRELWEKLGIKKVERVYWHKMSDDDLLDYFRKDYTGLSRRELQLANGGLYQALLKRKLIEEAISGTKQKQFPRHFFKKMTDDELKDYYSQNYSHVTTRDQLGKECSLLLENLWQRGLLDSVGLESKLKNPRNLREQKDEELVKYFRTNYENITTRTQLARKDWVLYHQLRKRTLLDTCFEQRESGSIDLIIESYVTGESNE